MHRAGGGGARSSPGTSSASASPSDPPAEPVTLTFAVYGSRGSVAAYDELARSFTKNNPRITVEVERAPDVTDAMASYEQAYAEGNPPDVFLVDHDHLPALVEQDMVQPVDGLLEERDLDFGDGYQRDGLESFAASDALQCMPHDVSPTVVYYNKDLVDLTRLVEEGETPPNAEDGWTWEEFSLAARQASRVKGKGVYIEPTLRALAPFVWSAGADIVDDVQDPTTLTLSEGDTREALEEVLALVRDPLVTPTRAELAEEDALQPLPAGPPRDDPRHPRAHPHAARPGGPRLRRDAAAQPRAVPHRLGHDRLLHLLGHRPRAGGGGLPGLRGGA